MAKDLQQPPANLNGRGFIRGEEYTTVYDTTRTRRSTFLSNPFKASVPFYAHSWSTVKAGADQAITVHRLGRLAT